jgi:hypothetical protein
MRAITSFRGSHIVSQLMIHKPATKALVRRIWLPGVLACGFGLTAAWVSLLGYFTIRLITLAF